MADNADAKSDHPSFFYGEVLKSVSAGMNLDSNSEMGIGAPNKYPCAEGHPIEVRSAACSSFSMPSAMNFYRKFSAHLNYMLDDRLIRCSETQCLN